MNTFTRTAISAGVAAVGVLIFFSLHWIAVHVGATTVVSNKPFYNFWSGFGSDLGEFSILASLGAVYYKHNCHDKGCWRIGRHVVDGTPWCNKHHEQARTTNDQG